MRAMSERQASLWPLLKDIGNELTQRNASPAEMQIRTGRFMAQRPISHQTKEVRLWHEVEVAVQRIYRIRVGIL